MGTHDEFLELCALATSGELTEEEHKKLKEHLEACSDCRQAFAEYGRAGWLVTKALAVDNTTDETGDADASWSIEAAETALFDKLRQNSKSTQFKDAGIRPQSDFTGGRRHAYRPSRILAREIWIPFAACVLLALALGIAAYRTGVRRGTEVSRSQVPSVRDSASSLREELSDTGHERALLLARLSQEDKTIFDLKRQLGQANLLLGGIKASDDENKLAARSDSAADSSNGKNQESQTKQYEAAQSLIQELQKKIDIESEQEQQASTRVAELEKKVDGLTQTLSERERVGDQQQAEISRQRELLDHDRDIRELMGARDLYIAEVYDVAKTGQTNKTYGRVFYTKGKSLIFYAYDLDQQIGMKTASSFQAWGRRGPDKTQALNLGIFYEDNVGKKRWMLKFDDPKSLEQVDAVFVTVEPNGGSHRPSGKQLLFAYLRIDPNHP